MFIKEFKEYLSTKALHHLFEYYMNDEVISVAQMALRDGKTSKTAISKPSPPKFISKPPPIEESMRGESNSEEYEVSIEYKNGHVKR